MTNTNYIKKLRSDAGITLKEAGAKVGISESGYAKIEKRWPDIQLGTLVRIANAFGYKVNVNVVGDSSKQS